MIGYEFEFLVREEDGPLRKETFLKFHKELARRGWEQKYDADTKELLGSSQKDIFVTTDDGVNDMEINMPPTKTIQESHERMTQLIEELQAIYKNMGASIIGTSVFPGPFHPGSSCAHVCASPYISGKSFIRYVVPQRWRQHHLTQVIAAHQVWLDLSKREIMRELRAFNRLSPFFIALFANGPVFNMKKLSGLEGRNILWREELDSSTVAYDSKIYGMYPTEYATLFDYLDFILDMPFYFCVREGLSFKLADTQATFRDFLFSKSMPALWGHGGAFTAYPMKDDFFELQHATFPHVRLKFFIKNSVSLEKILEAIQHKNESAFLDCFEKFCMEVRVNSAQMKTEISAGPALFLGLQSNFSKTERFLKQFSYGDILALCTDAEKTGLNARIGTREISELASELVSIAHEGLVERGYGEEIYLKPLMKRIAHKKNPAQELCGIWEEKGLSGIYAARDY